MPTRVDLRTHNPDGTPRQRARKRRIDPHRFAKEYLENGRNQSAAFQKLRGTATISPKYALQGGNYYMSKPEVKNAIQLLEAELERSSQKAIRKVDQLIDSKDEVIAGQNARFVIEHVKGKPIARNLNTNFNIEAAIDELILE